MKLEELIGKRIAVIRIAGEMRLNPDIKKTLELLNLTDKFRCSIITLTDKNIGMLQKVIHHTTFGEISVETEKLLKTREEKDRKGEVKKFYRLHPPLGGFERKGTKKLFAQKGALGYRGDKMDDLVKRMVPNDKKA